MANETNVGTLFLKQFIKQLIVESKTHLPKNQSTKPQEAFPEIPFQEQIRTKTLEIPGNPIQQNISKIPRTINIRKNLMPIRQIKKPSPKIPLIRPMPGYIDLGKINFLIADHWVQSIECQGPNKRITVKKGSKILSTDIILTGEEIEKIIDEFSITTKIPLAKGILKAIHNNLMITAVISEIIGSRFIIQKINPNTIIT